MILSNWDDSTLGLGVQLVIQRTHGGKGAARIAKVYQNKLHVYSFPGVMRRWVSKGGWFMKSCEERASSL